MADKVLAFLMANAGLTDPVETEQLPVPKVLTSTLTPVTGTALVKATPYVTQIESFMFQGIKVWCVTYSDFTWERIYDPKIAYMKSLELFPAGPPTNH